MLSSTNFTNKDKEGKNSGYQLENSILIKDKDEKTQMKQNLYELKFKC